VIFFVEFFCHPCLDEPLARGSLGVGEGVKNIHTTEQHLLKGNAGRHACIFDDKESTSERSGLSWRWKWWLMYGQWVPILLQ